MTPLKITLLVDPDHGEQLVGLLAKALGRGELGISDLRIEATTDRAVTMARKAERLILEAPASKIAATLGSPKPKRKGGRGNRNVDVTRGGAKALVDRLMSGPASYGELRKILPAAGYKANSLGSLLARLKDHGIIESVGKGSYQLKTA